MRSKGRTTLGAAVVQRFFVLCGEGDLFFFTTKLSPGIPEEVRMIGGTSFKEQKTKLVFTKVFTTVRPFGAGEGGKTKTGALTKDIIFR